GRPQVDFEAQRETAERHAGESRPLAIATSATAVAHRTYTRVLGMLAQSHGCAISVRTAARSARSPGESQVACADERSATNINADSCTSRFMSDPSGSGVRWWMLRQPSAGGSSGDEGRS